MLTIRQASPDDADQISKLISSLSHFFFAVPEGSGAENFADDITPEALRIFVARPDVHYLTGEWRGEFCGAAAIRKPRHLHHLFVAPAHHGRGIGRQLWLAARDAALAAGNPGEFTVNASLNAVPVYERFGFERFGTPQQANGLIFQPMRLMCADGKPPAQTLRS